MAPIKRSFKSEYDYALCQLVAKAVTGRPFYGVTESSKKRAYTVAVPFIKQWIANPFSIAPEHALRLKNNYDDIAILMRMGWLNAVNSINNGSYSADISSTGVSRENAVADHGDMEEYNSDGVPNYVTASVASSCDSVVSHALLPIFAEEIEQEAADDALAAVDQSVPSSIIIYEDDEDEQQEGYVDESGHFVYLDLEDDVFGESAPSAKALFEATVAGNGTLPVHAGCRETFIKMNGEVVQECDLEKMDFVAILQHISAKYFHSMASETEFLQMLHRFKPAINYQTLPLTGRQLMKVRKLVHAALITSQMQQYQLSSSIFCIIFSETIEFERLHVNILYTSIS